MSLPWKSKYVKWYRILESIYRNEIPHLTDEEIEDCVSEKDWIIIPIGDEKSRIDARNAQRPNLYFNLSKKDRIEIGVTYDKVESVNRLREIIAPFNVAERDDMLKRLHALPDNCSTRVFKKTKESNWMQSPDYEETFVRQSNRMDLAEFTKVFAEVDRINAARDKLYKSKYQLAPAINLADVYVPAYETSFKEILSVIRPLYEVAVKVKTEKEYKQEVAQRTAAETKSRQKEFAKYVEELKEEQKQGKITPEEYRDSIMRYSKEHQ